MKAEDRKKNIPPSAEANLKPVCEKYYDDIYRFCYIRLRSQQEAMDCTQEAFERYYERLRTNADIQNPKAYIYKIAKHVCAKRINQIKILKQKYSELYPIVDSLTLEEQLELEQLEDKIDGVAKDIISSLCPEELELYTAYYINQTSAKEIAEKYGVSTSWVNKRIVVLKQVLQRKVQKYLMGGNYRD